MVFCNPFIVPICISKNPCLLMGVCVVIQVRLATITFAANWESLFWGGHLTFYAAWYIHIKNFGDIEISTSFFRSNNKCSFWITVKCFQSSPVFLY